MPVAKVDVNYGIKQQCVMQNTHKIQPWQISPPLDFYLNCCGVSCFTS